MKKRDVCVELCERFHKLELLLFFGQFRCSFKERKKKNAVNLILCTSFFIILFNFLIYVGVFWCKFKEIHQKKSKSPVPFPPPPLYSLPPPCIYLLPRIIKDKEIWLWLPNDSSKFFSRQNIFATDKICSVCQWLLFYQQKLRAEALFKQSVIKTVD